MITTMNLPDNLHAVPKLVAEAERRSAAAVIIMAVADHARRHDNQGRIRTLATAVAERHKDLLDRLARDCLSGSATCKLGSGMTVLT